MEKEIKMKMLLKEKKKERKDKFILILSIFFFFCRACLAKIDLKDIIEGYFGTRQAIVINVTWGKRSSVWLLLDLFRSG